MARPEGLGRRLLEGRLGTAVLTGLFIATGVFDVFNERFLNAAQLWAAHLASRFFAYPVETLFLPGASPLDAAAFAPFAGSLETFGVAHVVFAAVSIPLVAERARALSVPYPNVAALLVAASPTLLAAAPSGIAGADGVVLVALALYVLDAHHQGAGARVATGARATAAAGVTLGLLGLLRPELIALSLAISWARRDRSLALFAAIIPGVYLGAGAVVHGDAAFIAAALTTPSLHGPLPISRASDWALALAATCPAIGLAIFFPKTAQDDGEHRQSRESRPSTEHRETIAAAAFAALVLLLGSLDLRRVGLSPERLAPALPLIAVPLARAARGLEKTEFATRVVVILLVTLAGGLALNLDTGSTFLFAVVSFAGAVVAVARYRPRAAVPALIIACLVGGPLGVRASRLAAEDQTFGLHPVHAWARNAPEVLRGRRLVTDCPLVGRVVGSGAPNTRFTWPERYAAPLGLDAETEGDLAWVLEGHPFGSVFRDANAGSDAIDIGDLVIVEEDTLQTQFHLSRRFRLLQAGELGVYQRVLDEGGPP